MPYIEKTWDENVEDAENFLERKLRFSEKILLWLNRLEETVYDETDLDAERKVFGGHTAKEIEKMSKKEWDKAIQEGW